MNEDREPQTATVPARPSRGRPLRTVQIVAGIALLALLGWAVTRGLERLLRPQTQRPAPAATAATGQTAHITATLFYAAGDGQALVAVRREVPLAGDIVAQGREILVVQLQPPPQPHVSVIPQGTTLRAFYVTDQGDAFVDVSRDITAAHPGGSTTEMLTVQALVSAVTTNLPAVKRVQLLVDGKEVDTIAGHVDVRGPLTADATIVKTP